MSRQPPRLIPEGCLWLKAITPVSGHQRLSRWAWSPPPHTHTHWTARVPACVYPGGSIWKRPLDSAFWTAVGYFQPFRRLPDADTQMPHSDADNMPQESLKQETNHPGTDLGREPITVRVTVLNFAQRFTVCETCLRQQAVSILSLPGTL